MEQLSPEVRLHQQIDFLGVSPHLDSNLSGPSPSTTNPKGHKTSHGPALENLKFHISSESVHFIKHRERRWSSLAKYNNAEQSAVQCRLTLDDFMGAFMIGFIMATSCLAYLLLRSIFNFQALAYNPGFLWWSPIQEESYLTLLIFLDQRRLAKGRYLLGWIYTQFRFYSYLADMFVSSSCLFWVQFEALTMMSVDCGPGLFAGHNLLFLPSLPLSSIGNCYKNLFNIHS